MNVTVEFLTQIQNRIQKVAEDLQEIYDLEADSAVVVDLYEINHAVQRLIDHHRATEEASE